MKREPEELTLEEEVKIFYDVWFRENKKPSGKKWPSLDSILRKGRSQTLLEKIREWLGMIFLAGVFLLWIAALLYIWFFGPPRYSDPNMTAMDYEEKYGR